MPAHPLLRLPAPSISIPPKGTGRGPILRIPSATRQKEKYDPQFQRLRDLLSREGGALSLRADPSSLAPDRVIVFEVAGSVKDFVNALARIKGLEFMAEYESDFAADEDFAVQALDKEKKPTDRKEKPVPSRLYLAMPDVRALEELLSLWERWKKEGRLGRGYAPFAHLFQQLHALRPWGPQDRIPDETVAFWRQQIADSPNQPVRTEMELWFRENERRRHEASEGLKTIIAIIGGSLVQESIISEISYHGMLVDIPGGEIQGLMERRQVNLAIVDDLMVLRPQSLLLGPLQVEPDSDAIIGTLAPPPSGEPIAALLDGVPLQNHVLLADRLMIDDPDDLQSRSVVSSRVHGTAMASLILHGDRNEQNNSLQRPLYVRPLMVADGNGEERTERDRLLIDTIYRSIVRIKGSESIEGAAPTVFMINLSIGDMSRPFSGLISPLARLLDYMSDKYGLLFLVSGGNVRTPLEVPEFENWSAFVAAAPPDRERAVLTALNSAKHQRTILSPAESINALTIGAQHHDHLTTRPGIYNLVDPFQDDNLPNVSSGLGLGYRRMIKPELYLPGGREHVRMMASGNGVRIAIGFPQKLYGLKAAAPDPSGQGRLNQVALSDGTSSATALATRAGHQIFDSLTQSESLLADMDPRFYAVVIKTLLMHSAHWNGNEELLKEICGPEDRLRHVERADNSCRFIGFGVPEIIRAIECSDNRATLVGFDEITPETAHVYRIPLPGCLERVTDPRSLTVSICWISPIRSRHQSYRSVRLEAESLNQPVEVLGVRRRKGQPADVSIKRGTAFHELYEGSSAVPFIDDGHLALRVWCKEDAGLYDERPIRYGIAVTIESGSALPIYDEIQQRLRIRPRPPS